MSNTIKTAINAEDFEKYSNPIPSREYIMALFDEPGKYLNREQLGKTLKLFEDEEKEALRRRLRAMERDGQLNFDPRKGYSLLTQDDLIEGTVIGHADGFGFLSLDGPGDDLYLHEKQMLKAFPGDRVQARISGVDRRGRQEAQIIKVLEQNMTQVVGRLRVDDGEYFLQPENSRMRNEIDIPDDQLNGAEAGQYVTVEITEYPCNRFNAEGKVVELLGDSMAPGMEIDVAIRNHDIPHKWPQDALNAAEALGDEVNAADKQHRADLRSLPFVTIDGEDARDFDDAVYCEKRKSGGWRLFVAIADVSHYVVPGSPLDIEAAERGTSVYFPGHVVPMLPEALSNGLCSLNPHVDRLVMVCEMSINNAGKMTSYTFSEGIIHSHARLTYTQVGALVSAAETHLGKQVAQQHAEVVPHLHALHQLYAVLRKARTKRGSIDFEKQEVQFKFTEDRKIDRIVPVERNDAHKMIEEFMLCANVATAQFLEKVKLPALYRIHEGPVEKKLTNLRAFLSERGLNLAGGEKPTPAHYDRLLKSLGDRPDAQIIRTMMLRSLSQAEYSSDNQGHFGLAYPAYAHFTSPIRRYPDLLVHRAIRSVIRRSQGGSVLRRTLQKITGSNADSVHRVKSATPLDQAKSYPYDLSAMKNLAEHCSLVSRRADKAGWDVEAWLKCEYMQDHVGDVFSGVISSVTNFGLFIELDDTQVEGLVHVTALNNDYYQFDAAQQRLVGERTRASFAIGDKIDIRVVRVDMDQRKIEFELAYKDDAQASTKPKARKGRGKGSRKYSKK
ncbi:ribonuclease R [Amphritea sp. 1_MG-2023]|uniref:ribonuclease R n=1 Tax=Amphritea sp. 1_MG-2023 TaxID=3062670 RepID=UPI0026E3B666|nr:ribonuclease R [Amphritea sp. 1_MG-2023]MDO6562007.1 ribonuclease R [Amphritea sp. 1_MG-2023]